MGLGQWWSVVEGKSEGWAEEGKSKGGKKWGGVRVSVKGRIRVNVARVGFGASMSVRMILNGCRSKCESDNECDCERD